MDDFFLNDLRAKSEAAKKAYDAALVADEKSPDFARNLEVARKAYDAARANLDEAERRIDDPKTRGL